MASCLDADRHPLFDGLTTQGPPLLDGEHAQFVVAGQRKAPLPCSDHLAVVADITVPANWASPPSCA